MSLATDEQRARTVPRRRQRKEIEDGGSLPRQPERKRSKLSNDSYMPLPNGTLEDANNSAQTNGHAAPDYPDSHPPDTTMRIPVREKRRARRPSREDASTSLVTMPPIGIAQKRMLMDLRRPKTLILSSNNCPEYHSSSDKAP